MNNHQFYFICALLAVIADMMITAWVLMVLASISFFIGEWRERSRKHLFIKTIL